MGAPDRHRFQRLAAAVPDEPSAVELRAMLLAADGELDAGPDGFLVTDASRLQAAVWGRPSPAAIRRVTGLLRGVDAAVTCRRQILPHLRDVLSDWPIEAANLYDRPVVPAATATFPRVRVLDGTVSLAHCPPALREELQRALANGREVLALVDGDVPVSFAYCPWTTETLEDVSIDTIPERRRRGFATETVRALLQRIAARGRRPIWGALTSNIASNALAAKLGFRRCGELFVLHRPGRAAAVQ